MRGSYLQERRHFLQRDVLQYVGATLQQSKITLLWRLHVQLYIEVVRLAEKAFRHHAAEIVVVSDVPS